MQLEPLSTQNSQLLSGYEGDFANASASSVLFLWENWETYFKLHNVLLNCSPTSKFSWEARSFFGSGEWYLTQHNCTPNSGFLHFHNYVHFLGNLAKVQTIFQYRRVKDGRIWYSGGGYGEIPRWLNPISFLPRLISSTLLRSIGRTGGKIAEQITLNPEEVLKKCGEEAFVTYQQYILEEQLFRSGCSPNNEFFTQRQLLPVAIYERKFQSSIACYESEILDGVASLLDALPPETDASLLEVVVDSLPMGIPGAATLAIRDFLKQHRWNEQSPPQLNSLISGQVGRMKLYRGVESAIEAELGCLAQVIGILVREAKMKRFEGYRYAD